MAASAAASRHTLYNPNIKNKNTYEKSDIFYEKYFPPFPPPSIMVPDSAFAKYLSSLMMRCRCLMHRKFTIGEPRLPNGRRKNTFTKEVTCRMARKRELTID